MALPPSSPLDEWNKSMGESSYEMQSLVKHTLQQSGKGQTAENKVESALKKCVILIFQSPQIQS